MNPRNRLPIATENQTNQIFTVNMESGRNHLYNKWTRNIIINGMEQDQFRHIIDEKINCKIRLKTPSKIEKAVKSFKKTIQEAAIGSFPNVSSHIKRLEDPIYVVDKIRENRRLRKQWQKKRSAALKTQLNRLQKDIKLILKNEQNRRTS